jgi:hypothetical protein
VSCLSAFKKEDQLPIYITHDGLPCATFRKIKERAYLLGLYNWTESDTTVTPNWNGTVLESATSFTCLKIDKTFTHEQLAHSPPKVAHHF